MTVPAMVSKRGFAALAVAVVASTVAATAGAAPDPASPTRVAAVLRSETTGYPWRGGSTRASHNTVIERS
jgi:hypothetical protein